MLNFAILHRDDDIENEILKRDNDRGALPSGACRHQVFEHEHQTRFFYSGTT
jgi:hypothetical protein